MKYVFIRHRLLIPFCSILVLLEYNFSDYKQYFSDNEICISRHHHKGCPPRFQTPIIAASTRLILLQQQHLYSSSSKIRSETRIESQKTPLLPIWCTTQIWCTTRFFPFWKTYVSFCTWTGTRLVLFSFWIFSVGQRVSNSS